MKFSNSPSRIVCVGASAGGLEALTAFLKFLPKNIDMAFVLIQHLEPSHKSALTEILSRETSLIVREAENNMKIESAHIYVIPPNTLMAISGRTLKVTARASRADGKYLPIDFFMASLAEDEKEKAVGIILSGTGSDGTQGAKAIKKNRGIVFAQNENTARYFGMPESVIASGSADFVLEPKDIVAKLVSLKTRKHENFLEQISGRHSKQDDFKKILVFLRDLTGTDFIHYKKTTVVRRIARRMLFCNIKSYAEYYSYLKANPAEVDILCKDILIPVTSFFRDPKIFSALRKQVFPFIANKRSSQNPIRLWIPACSSGEEVYSFAIVLYEFLEERNIKPHIQIFGTDLSEALIEKSRAGVYQEDISEHVSAERLRRFFIKTEAGYKIAKHIRDFCIFAKHDITNDPPLSNMDIVSCRNLLIYFDAFLQSKVLLTLHYAIKPKGFLVLGTSESVMSMPDFFVIVDKKEKIYSKNIVSRKNMPMSGMQRAEAMPIKTKSGKIAKKTLLSLGYDKLFQDISLKKLKKIKRRGSDMSDVNKIISGSSGTDIVKLKREFARTVERLNGISEEKDTFNEELKAANEEIQSSNEELQSMNEELETSKEELQSTNEELLTLNEELQDKNAELTRLNSDLSNVFSSTNIPIIIVGNDLRIKRFTPTARKVMNLIPTDVERPIGDIKLNVDISNLEGMILDVIEDMSPKESEVRDKDGRWYSMRIRPYRTVDNKIDGAIITLIDIDIIKRNREEAQGALNYAEAIIETIREPLVVLDKDARILSANKSFYSMFKVEVSDIAGKLLYELGGTHWNNANLRKLLGDILLKKNYFNDVEVSFSFPKIGQRTMILNGRQIKLHGKDSPLILLVIEDITKRKKAEDIMKRDNKTLDKMINKRSKELLRLQMELVKAKHLSAIGTLAATVAHELRNPLADITLAIHRIKKIVKDPAVEGILSGMNARVLESDQIISNILMYSKTTITHYELIKINDILRSSIDDEALKFSAKKIFINEKTDCTKDLYIDADPVRIKEVFHNILHNAFEAVHMYAGMVEIETFLNNSKVSIVVKDNGEGIAKKDLKNVTNPFFTTKAKGMGLGLSVCKQIVMLHSGSITIKSVKGKGTSVTVVLPIHKQKNA